MNAAKLLLLTLPALLALNAGAADLEVEVQGLASTEGQVLLAAYADAGDWLKKPVAVARAAAAEARDGRLVLLVQGVPEGAAISLFHDRDGNGRLNVNAMGMPIEPYGFSNDAAGNFGPPSFEQARLAPGATRITVRLN
ncbi:DUF2141 domain-containing protein [Pelomonas sp. KK5]|uniref:DUF2141 domain-containing protein n=1 Tax=Pelomonas sp. KK5 TaxID=1855730 RepID=UPI00097C80CE|nr:DUF2141 domain-containing protein [Pelomonas sp. KK5]